MFQFRLAILSLLLAWRAPIVLAALIDNVPNVEQLGELDGSEIRGDNYIEWPLKPGQRFAKKLECVKGFELVFSGKYVACCMPGQRLLGSFDTVWECCGANHDLVGSKETGYSCCPTGQIFDGKKCKDRVVCNNGKLLVDGKCTCPDGQVEDEDGWCQVNKCDSGLETGKCYTFTDDRGLMYGFSNAGWYTAARDDRTHIFGKFQLCRDEACTKGHAVNPNTGNGIRDIHGRANSGINANEWLANQQNGDHIGKTPLWSQAGNFTLTKWPCGKYCLGGFDHGLGPTCPSDTPAFTFNTGDKQACQVVTVNEVPCDIHTMENNCIWKNGDQCCNQVDCSAIPNSASQDRSYDQGSQKVLT